MRVLVTGAAGFIGYHVVGRLLARGDTVLGVDSLNEYYDVGLKYARLDQHGITRATVQHGKVVRSDLYPEYSFLQARLEERALLTEAFVNGAFDGVCHLAAQAGVRYSLTNPQSYIDSNIQGFLNILECCRAERTGHLVFASSSSVYGLNETMPFRAADPADHPVSLYAATKKANELMAHAYSHLYGMPATGLRFFTVYGPWGRPDMALFLFTRAAFAGAEIDVFNNGDMQRDFTYVDDIAEGVVRVIDSPARSNTGWNGRLPDPASSRAPFRVYNIGNNSPVRLLDLIQLVEEFTGRPVKKRFLPMQPGDVAATCADVSDLEREIGYRPSTSIREGVRRFTDWYKSYYRVGT